jgi:hypothetical protein
MPEGFIKHQPYKVLFERFLAASRGSKVDDLRECECVLRIVGRLAITCELAALEQHKGIRQGHRIQSIEINRGAFNQRGITIG